VFREGSRKDQNTEKLLYFLLPRSSESNGREKKRKKAGIFSIKHQERTNGTIKVAPESGQGGVRTRARRGDSVGKPINDLSSVVHHPVTVQSELITNQKQKLSNGRIKKHNIPNTYLHESAKNGEEPSLNPTTRLKR